MSQLERQYDELEEVGRDIEQALRDAEESKCDVVGMDLKGSLFSYESVNLLASLPFHPSYSQARGAADEVLAGAGEREEWSSEKDV